MNSDKPAITCASNVLHDGKGVWFEKNPAERPRLWPKPKLTAISDFGMSATESGYQFFYAIRLA